MELTVLQKWIVCGHETRRYRFPLDVSANAQTLRNGHDGVIVALVLPKGPAVTTQHLVGSIGGGAFQRSKPLGCHNMRRHQQMHMIGHDHKRMELITLKSTLTISQSFNHQVRNLWLC